MFNREPTMRRCAECGLDVSRPDVPGNYADKPCMLQEAKEPERQLFFTGPGKEEEDMNG